MKRDENLCPVPPFELFQIIAQFVNVRLGEGVGLHQRRHQIFGAAAEHSPQRRAALGFGVFPAGYRRRVQVATSLLVPGDKALFLQTGQQCQQRSGCPAIVGKALFQFRAVQRFPGGLERVHHLQLRVGQACKRLHETASPPMQYVRADQSIPPPL